jgi:hypothetical protein
VGWATGGAAGNVAGDAGTWDEEEMDEWNVDMYIILR